MTLYDRRDQLTSFVEMVWRCKIRHQHHVKMGSYPYCYRCGKRP